MKVYIVIRGARREGFWDPDSVWDSLEKAQIRTTELAHDDPDWPEGYIYTSIFEMEVK
jgi:hypothetical protein